jgi:AcrR family transcriptional regulator
MRKSTSRAPEAETAQQILKQPPARVRNRRRVLRAAKILITEHGLEALTMRRLAAEADVSVATLYNLIGGRDDVVRALGLYFVDELQEAYGNADSPDPVDRAREILTALIDTVIAELPRPLILALLSDPRLYAELTPDWDDPLSAVLHEMVAKGILVEDINIDLVSKQVWWNQMTYQRQWAAGRLNEKELHAAIQYLLDVCLLALATPASREDIVKHARSLEKKLKRL